MVKRSIFTALLAVSTAIVFGQERVEWAPNELIVKFPAQGAITCAFSSMALGAKPVQTLDNGQTVRMKLPRTVSMNQAYAMYKSAGALYVEPNYVLHSTMTPNDPYFNEQYGPKLINCQTAWDTTLGSSSVIIAIVDTGVDLTHSDLSAKLVAGKDLVNDDDDPSDDNGHGTHCAGVAAASTNNSVGIAGVAPNCKIMPVKVLDSGGNGYLSVIAQGIRYAADNGAKVISLSLGSTSQSQTLQDAINYATSKGALVVAAAGNNSSSQKFYPAACDGVLSVAAIASSSEKASFSNYGSWVSVAAPGVSILSCWTNNSYAYCSGTSMATPHVAGVAALLYSYFGLNSSPSTIKSKIQNSCDSIGSWIAYGRVNASTALSSSDNSNDNSNSIPSDVALPNDLTIVQGNWLSGTIDTLLTSDNDRVMLQSTGTRSQAVQVIAPFNVGAASTIKQLVLTFECVGSANGSISFAAYNNTKRKWVNLSSFSYSKTEKTGNMTLKLKWSQFIDDSGSLQIRLLRSAWTSTPFTIGIDRMSIKITSL